MFNMKRVTAILILFAMVLILSSVSADAGSQLSCVEGTNGVYALEGPNSLFDGRMDTKWCLKMSTNPYVIFQAENSISIQGYIFYTCNDNEECDKRNPSAWTLYGSNKSTAPKQKDKSWEVIDSRTGSSVIADRNFHGYLFLLDKPAPSYKYYMLVVDKNQGSAYFQLSEIQVVTSLDDVTCIYTVYNNPDHVCAASIHLDYGFRATRNCQPFMDRLILSGGLTDIPEGLTFTEHLQILTSIRTEIKKQADIEVVVDEAYTIDEKKTDAGKLQISGFTVVLGEGEN